MRGSAVIAVLLSANLAAAAPSEPIGGELGVSAGAGLRQSRGGFDTGKFGGYAVGMPALVGVDASLWIDGRHGLVARGSLLRDLPIQRVAPEHFNLSLLDLGYAYRATLVRRGEARLTLRPSAGVSLGHADAVWGDGLRFFFPCVGFDSGTIERCQRERDAIRDTENRFDHTALGGFVTASLAVELGRFTLGGAVDQRLLASLGSGPALLHHVSSLRALGGVAF